jgi:ABC-2 type transport system permease protein
MRKFISLFNVQLKSIVNFSALKADKKERRKIAGFVAILLCLTPSYIFYFSMLDVIYSAFASLNQQGALLAIGAIGTSMIVLIFGLMYVFSALFGAKDLEMFLSFPIRSRLIVASKLAYLIVIEYIFVLPFMLPVLITYASLSAAGLVFWVGAVLMLLLMPIIPLSLVTVIEVLIVRLFSMRFNVEKIQTVFMFVFIAVMLAINFSTTRLASVAESDTQMQLLTAMISDNQYLINALTKIYFPAKMFAVALTGASALNCLLNFAGFAALSIASYFFAVWVCDAVYMAGVSQGISKNSAKKRNLTALEIDKSYASAPKFMRIFTNDMKVIMRTPIFAFNLLLIIPLLPAIMIGSVLSQGVALSQIGQLVASLGPMACGFGVVACLFCTTLVTISSSSFSREGRAFWLNQIIPVGGRDQLLGRTIGTVMASFILSLILLGIVGYIAQWGLLLTAVLILTATLASLPVALVGLLIDLCSPKLDWDDPAAAVKRNGNVLISTLIAMANVLILGFCV